MLRDRLENCHSHAWNAVRGATHPLSSLLEDHGSKLGWNRAKAQPVGTSMEPESSFQKVNPGLRRAAEISTTNADREAEFDLVIRGGRIVVGTRMPAYYSDIAVKAGVVVEIRSVRGNGRQGLDSNYSRTK